MLECKKIFITGGAGFIANKIISELVDKNTIIIYDNFFRDTLSGSEYADHKNIKVIRGDVLDYELVFESMQDADIVIHCAAIAGIDTVRKNPVNTMRVNMIGTANVLEAAYQNNISGRVVVFSTSEVFGSMAFNLTEADKSIIGTVGKTRWTYAVSKLAGEHLAIAYYSKYKLPVVSVRPFNVYGPGQTGESAMSVFIKRALKNKDIHIHGDGNQIRAWCYLDDFVEGLLYTITKPKAIGESFNIGNARAVLTIYGLAQTICHILNSRSKIIYKPPQSEDVELRIPGVKKMETLLNFKAKIDLSEGIKRTAEAFKKQVV